jgi:hypothetical protein
MIATALRQGRIHHDLFRMPEKPAAASPGAQANQPNIKINLN